MYPVCSTDAGIDSTQIQPDGYTSFSNSSPLFAPSAPQLSTNTVAALTPCVDHAGTGGQRRRCIDRKNRQTKLQTSMQRPSSRPSSIASCPAPLRHDGDASWPRLCGKAIIQLLICVAVFAGVVLVWTCPVVLIVPLIFVMSCGRCPLAPQWHHD